jgi:hypothetical protein
LLILLQPQYDVTEELSGLCCFNVAQLYILTDFQAMLHGGVRACILICSLGAHSLFRPPIKLFESSRVYLSSRIQAAAGLGGIYIHIMDLKAARWEEGLSLLSTLDELLDTE